MEISARVHNSSYVHSARVSTNGREQKVSIRPKDAGYGSSINGGELLFLALATCCCNDIYREAKKLGVPVSAVDVHVEGIFGAEGEPALDVHYRVDVTSDAPEAEVLNLIQHTDTVSEIQNTLRSGVAVKLSGIKVARP